MRLNLHRTTHGADRRHTRSAWQD